MQTIDRLGARDIVAVVTAYRDVLAAHQERINRLNVFPVPDGDTGTNMALTVDSVVAELASADHDDPGAVAAAVAHGSLMGARGNSGVILAQIMRALAAAFGGARPAGGLDAGTLPAALRLASDGAWAAVGNPVEGTILSVIRGAAEAAGATGGEASLVERLECGHQGAAHALARTPEQLPVLAAAGVVDAGGAGLLLLFDAFLHVADGRPLPAPPGPDAGLPGSRGSQPGGGAGPAAPSGPRYEVMYMLETDEDAVAGFRQVWAELGESVVVVGGEGTWHCHIHTDDIGATVEAGVVAGRPSRIRVTDLFDQAAGRAPAPTG
ncbi:MAG: DAK2 domain-containing protein, partial [Acidimicrobiales bacterium]